MENQNLSHKQMVEEFIQVLSSLYKISFLYSSNHSSFQSKTEELLETAKRYFELEEELVVVIFNKEFIYLDTPLFRDKPVISEFTKPFMDKGCNKFRINKNMTRDEIVDAVQVLCLDNKRTEEAGGFNALIMAKNIQNIVFEQIDLKNFKDQIDQTNSLGSSLGESGQSNDELKYATLDEIDELYDNLYSFPEGSDIFQNLIPLIKKARSFAPKIISIAKSDVNIYYGSKYTYTPNVHAVHVSILSARIALKLGIEFSDQMFENFVSAAMLHDIGKLLLDEKIQSTSSGDIHTELPSDYNKHIVKGAEIFHSINGIDPIYPVIAYEHHLGFNQGGFPEIPRDNYEFKSPHILANIVALCNKWDHAVEGEFRGRTNRTIVQRLIISNQKFFHPSIISALRQEI